METKSLVSFFESPTAFEEGQRMAKLLCASSLVPKDFQNNIANTVIALEMAHRVKASPLAVMQSLYIVHGKPSWSGQFIIAVINSSGRFRGPLRMIIDGDGDEKKCIASAIDIDGNTVEGAPVSIAMAKAEGWYQKSGSKWKTMPDLMLKYRAATFFGREYVPDLLMGMQTVEEVNDISHTGPVKIIDPDNLLVKDNRIIGITDKINAEILTGNCKTVADNDESCQENGNIDTLKAEIDALKTSIDVDQWRAGNSSYIIKTFTVEDQNHIFDYAEMAYRELKKAENN